MKQSNDLHIDFNQPATAAKGCVKFYASLWTDRLTP